MFSGEWDITPADDAVVVKKEPDGDLATTETSAALAENKTAGELPTAADEAMTVKKESDGELPAAGADTLIEDHKTAGELGTNSLDAESMREQGDRWWTGSKGHRC